MSGLIKQTFIVLVLVLFCFGGSMAATNATKFASNSNQQCMVRSTLIDLNLNEIHYYPFIISMNRCDGSWNTTEDCFGRIWVPNKMEDMNLKVFNMIKVINEPKTLAKHISYEYRCAFDGRKCN